MEFNLVVGVLTAAFKVMPMLTPIVGIDVAAAPAILEIVAAVILAENVALVLFVVENLVIFTLKSALIAIAVVVDVKDSTVFTAVAVEFFHVFLLLLLPLLLLSLLLLLKLQ